MARSISTAALKDRPGEVAADAHESPTDDPIDSLKLHDAADDAANDSMPSPDEECGREIETAEDAGNLVAILTEQTECEVWAIHDGTAWRYGLTWEHSSLGSRATPSRLMPGEGFSTALAAIGTGLGIARMDLLGKDADAVRELEKAIEAGDLPKTETVESLAEEIKDELQDRINQGEPTDMTPIHIVNTPVEPRPRTPAPSTALVDATEILRKIAEAEAEAEAAAREVEARKADLKDAKEDYEAAINRLRRLSRQIVADASRPLLAVAEAKAAEVVQEGGESPSPIAESTAEVSADPSPKDESWRECRFDDTAEFSDEILPASIVNKLAEASIETVGQLSDFQAKHGEFWAKEIKGVGKSKAEKISDAMIEFWSRHPEATEATTAAK